MAETRDLLFMTGNQGKIREAESLFSPLGFRISQLLVNGEVPTIIEPQVESLEEVTRSKLGQALTILQKNGVGDIPALLVEDSGLFVDSLNGFPGVYSSPVFETIGYEGILKLLGEYGANHTAREAEFRTVAALFLDGETIIAEGVCPGRIAVTPAGAEGFGYDPVFIPSDLDIDGRVVDLGLVGIQTTSGRTFGEISLEEKQKFSHRAKALTNLCAGLNQRH